LDGVDIGDRTKDQFEAMIHAGIAEAPMTVCHGDFRGDNLMFDDRASAEDEVAVLDWQITYRGPAVTDVAYFLCQSLTLEERRAHERELLRGWYDELGVTLRREQGRELDDYPFDLAWDQYRRAALGTTVYPVVAIAQMDAANERGLELTRAMASRAFTACLDLGSAEFLV
jgi:aminoglycoside phosphotransferase (APT) family kinase protein